MPNLTLNHDALDEVLREKIARRGREVLWNGRIAISIFVLSASPLLVLGWMALGTFPGANRPDTLLATFAAFGLSIVIWNIGSSFRYQQRRSENERDRLENLRLSFLAVPPDRMEPRDLLATVNQLSGDLWPFMRHSIQRTDATNGEESESDRL